MTTEKELQVSWPPHREIHESHRSDLGNFLPSVVDAMRVQGMTTLAHLHDRIKYMMAIDALRERFGSVSDKKQNMEVFLLKDGVLRKAAPFQVEGRGFKEMATVIAFALDVDPVDLFGDPAAEENFIPSKANPGHKSDFSTFRPTIADAMRAQEMETYADLYREIKDLLAEPWAQAIFGNIKASYQSFHAAVSKSDKNRDRNIFANDGGYRAYAKVIAYVLKKEPHELFGKAPEGWVSPDRVKTVPLSDDWDDVVPGVAESVIRGRLPDILEQAMECLDERERYVLCHRYELDGHMYKTLSEIGEEQSVKIERIRQIERRALNKIRRSSYLGKLKPYLRDVQCEMTHESIALNAPTVA